MVALQFSVSCSCSHCKLQLIDYAVLRNTCDHRCNIHATCCLWQGNHMPPSYYIMKQVLGVREVKDIEWHSCEAGCTGWEPTRTSQWHKHKDDYCRKCHGKRFKMEMGRLVPVRVSSLKVDASISQQWMWLQYCAITGLISRVLAAQSNTSLTCDCCPITCLAEVLVCSP
jgi:hypothetical protein